MKSVILPSGAELKIALSPFGISKDLYQAVLREIKGMGLDSKTDVSALYKEIFCTGMASKDIEKCMWECFKRCTYNSGNGDLKIDEQTFEPSKAREDYMTVCIEVGKENILPFLKNLVSEFQRIFQEISAASPT